MMPTQDTTLDHMALVAAFRNESTRESAFTELVLRFQEKLYWHIRRLVICHEDTNDVLQNVFLRVWKSLDKFREDANLYTWLYRIATNASLTFLEAQKKRQSVSLQDPDYGIVQTLKAEQGFDPNKLEWRIQLAIQSLPEKQRAVFSLRYYDEMPYEEMSEVLDTSVGALKASYHHAVKKMESFFREN